MQQTLFNNTSDTQTFRKGLAIQKSHQKQAFSKQQQAFNRLVKRIENLQTELKNTGAILDEKLKYYSIHLHPLEREMTALRIEIIKMIFGYFCNKKPFSKKEKEAIRDILEMQLSEVLSFVPEPDDELKQIFEKIHGMKYEDAAEENFQDMKGEMEDLFEDAGFDINFDGMHSKMTPEEMMAKMAEMKAQFEEQSKNNQQKSESQVKTKKQLEKEEREKQVEEAKKKNISTIYRQLAKILHPDLETDELAKLEKEELMKQLTVAYENNDLHTLLRLELQWIQNEENDPSKLSDGKLKIYNEVMKEQVAGLEQQIFELENHPRYQPLRKSGIINGDITTVDMAKGKKEMEWMKQEMGKSLTNLKKSENEAIKEIRSLISQSKQAWDDSELMDFEAAFAEIMQVNYGRRKR